MNNIQLKTLLKDIIRGDPLKDSYDEGALIAELAEDLAKAREVKLPADWHELQ